MGASEMAPQEKRISPHKPGNLSSIPGTHVKGEEKTDSDFHSIRYSLHT